MSRCFRYGLARRSATALATLVLVTLAALTGVALPDTASALPDPPPPPSRAGEVGTVHSGPGRIRIGVATGLVDVCLRLSVGPVLVTVGRCRAPARPPTPVPTSPDGPGPTPAPTLVPPPTTRPAPPAPTVPPVRPVPTARPGTPGPVEPAAPARTAPITPTTPPVPTPTTPPAGPPPVIQTGGGPVPRPRPALTARRGVPLVATPMFLAAPIAAGAALAMSRRPRTGRAA